DRPLDNRSNNARRKPRNRRLNRQNNARLSDKPLDNKLNRLNSSVRRRPHNRPRSRQNNARLSREQLNSRLSRKRRVKNPSANSAGYRNKLSNRLRIRLSSSVSSRKRSDGLSGRMPSSNRLSRSPMRISLRRKQKGPRRIRTQISRLT